MRATVIDERMAIITMHEVLDDARCASLVGLAESVGFEDAPITTAEGFVMAKEVRDNTRVIVDSAERAAELWELLRPAVPPTRGDWTAVGLNERLRFYRYERGQRFVWHFDGAFSRRALPGTPAEKSHLTVLLYLNDDFDGGETQIIHGQVHSIKPARGGALLFDHHLRHQGSAVTRGRKYVLRTDVMYRASAC